MSIARFFCLTPFSLSLSQHKTMQTNKQTKQQGLLRLVRAPAAASGARLLQHRDEEEGGARATAVLHADEDGGREGRHGRDAPKHPARARRPEDKGGETAAGGRLRRSHHHVRRDLRVSQATGDSSFSFFFFLFCFLSFFSFSFFTFLLVLLFRPPSSFPFSFLSLVVVFVYSFFFLSIWSFDCLNSLFFY